MSRPSRLSRLSRRRLLGSLGGLAVAGLVGPGLAGCAAPYVDTRLTIATGGTEGVYYGLGVALAGVWQARLGLAVTPAVLATAGSVANLTLLAGGQADVGFTQADAAADQLTATAPDDPRAMRGLARIYDDVVHVVVPADAPPRRLADLRGARVSVGADDSGVFVVASRLLEAAGLAATDALDRVRLGINESVAALADGTIDAFFWSGGLPTLGVKELAARRPIRLLDLSDVLRGVRDRYPVYGAGTVPASTYGISAPVSTLIVRNFLVVPASMPDGLATTLADALFAGQADLVRATGAATAIDLRAAVGTQPVPLHPGAEAFYRQVKDG